MNTTNAPHTPISYHPAALNAATVTTMIPSTINYVRATYTNYLCATLIPFSALSMPNSMSAMNMGGPIRSKNGHVAGSCESTCGRHVHTSTPAVLTDTPTVRPRTRIALHVAILSIMDRAAGTNTRAAVSIGAVKKDKNVYTE